MVRLKFFAMLKGLVGREDVEMDIPGALTVGELKAKLVEEYPSLKDVLDSRSVLVSVNQEFGGNERKVTDGDEVAFLPPFSGG
ncbi:MAG: MoaD/ThiS family protein [Thermodesulfobacteriota bacterium]